jgi:lipopolysaccharide transport system ATP-binding protein
MGTAIILVSHSPGAIWSVCDRGLFMDHGKVLVDGPTEDAIRAYDEQNARNSIVSGKQFDHAVAKHEEAADGDTLFAEYGHQKGGTGDVLCREVHISQPPCLATRTAELDFGQPFEISAKIYVKEPHEDLLVRFTVDAKHYRFIATIDSYEQGLPLPVVAAGHYVIKAQIKSPNFRPGAYTLNFSVSKRGAGIHLFYWLNAASFIVKHPKDSFLYSENNAVMHLDSAFSVVQANEAPAVSPIEVV